MMAFMGAPEILEAIVTITEWGTGFSPTEIVWSEGLDTVRVGITNLCEDHMGHVIRERTVAALCSIGLQSRSQLEWNVTMRPICQFPAFNRAA